MWIWKENLQRGVEDVGFRWLAYTKRAIFFR